MATIAPTVSYLTADTILIFWETLTEADTAAVYNVAQYPHKTLQVIGTFGSATVVLNGSLDKTTFAGLSDRSETAISLTAAGLSYVNEYVVEVQPSASGGTGQDLDIYLLCSK